MSEATEMPDPSTEATDLPAVAVNDHGPTQPPGVIVARGGMEYRIKRLLVAVAVLLGYGLWSAYDGYVKMPRDNAEFLAAHPGAKKLAHPSYDIPFNRALGAAMPPLGLLMIGWVFYHSRGQVRLGEDDVLSAPGHPAVPLSAVTAVDRRQWDRKGIAKVAYALPGGPTGSITLDDFVYQREPIGQIYNRVLAAVEQPSTVEPVGATTAVGSSAGVDPA